MRDRRTLVKVQIRAALQTLDLQIIQWTIRSRIPRATHELRSGRDVGARDDAHVGAEGCCFRLAPPVSPFAHQSLLTCRRMVVGESIEKCGRHGDEIVVI